MEEMEEFRGNSNRSKEPTAKRTKSDPVIARPPVERKPSVWSRTRSLFVGDGSENIPEFVVLDVVIPAIKDLLYDVVTEGSHRALFGSGSMGRGRSGRSSSSTYQQYNRPVTRRNDPPPERPALERKERATHDFSRLTFRKIGEAEAIIDRLSELISQYGSARVSDFYDAIGLTADFTDEGFGWTDIRHARIRRVRDGYILDLPRTQQLD